MNLEDIPEVDIDKEARVDYKFVFVKGPTKHYIYGRRGLGSHHRVYMDFAERLMNQGIRGEFHCIGGGRIKINHERRLLLVDNRLGS